MATRPIYSNLTSSSADILNAIRNSASMDYQNYVPIATPDAQVIKDIGNIIMDMPTLQNEFINSLINRIGLVYIQSKTYENPWQMFKRGIMEFGETVEEVFVNIAKIHNYNAEISETEWMKREAPDVRAAFHVLNYKKFYKVTVQEYDLKRAFLAPRGMYDLIEKIVQSLYTSMNYHEFVAMKYLVAKHLLAGQIKPFTIPQINVANMKQIASTIKGVSNNMTFMNSDFNVAGVATHTLHEDQFIIMTSAFDAMFDVEVLAAAFNMDKADFVGHRVLVDSFGNFDNALLKEMFGIDEKGQEIPDFQGFTQAELEALSSVPAIIVDRNWFMIFDNLYQFRDGYNGQGLYWQYWLHNWKTLSVSPFMNAAVAIPATPEVTEITLTPATATLSAGSSIQFMANVASSNFAPQAVSYSLETAVDGVSITNSGYLTIGETVPSETVITVVGTSVFDSTVTGEATVTVA